MESGRKQKNKREKKMKGKEGIRREPIDKDKRINQKNNI